jgi:hypothetical protein
MRTLLSYTRFLCAVLLTALLASSCQKSLRMSSEPAATHNITIRFKAMAGADQLAFGNTYTNFWGEQYSVSAFKFYISHIQLTNSDSGTVYNVNKDEYFLVNFADSNAVTLKLKAVPNKYMFISFIVGVDSIRNVSGAQTGALDPANGMFWTWNTGYIMAKLEGNSPASPQVNNKFEYHIGGFSGPDHVLKPVQLLFPGNQDVIMQPEKNTELVINADVNSWFFNPNDIKIRTNAVCMTPGILARRISENYINMFTITNVHSE